MQTRFLYTMCEKEGIASSRRTVPFLLITLFNLLSTFGSLSLWCFGYETLLPELLTMENTGNQWNLQLLLIQTIKTKFIPLWWRGLLCLSGESQNWAGGRSPCQTHLFPAVGSWSVWQSCSSRGALGVVHAAWRAMWDNPVDDCF